MKIFHAIKLPKKRNSFITTKLGVSDPYSLDTDLDPAFKAEYQSGSRVLMTKKFTAEKKLIFRGSKTTIYLSLGLHKERPSYRRSLQTSKRTYITPKHFRWPFLPYWIRIPNLDKDPLTCLNQDPDPKHC
jgi:hypothetical protein